MASGGRKGGGDYLLESRHVVGLFLLLVVVFGMVFTLGYLLGRNQFDLRLHSAAAGDDNTVLAPIRKLLPRSDAGKAVTPQPDQTALGPGAPGWDFYHAGDSAAADRSSQTPSPVPSANEPESAAASNTNGAPPRAAKGSSARNEPLIPKGAIMLQVAALKSESDALALAQALQQKKIPAFVVPPGADNYYRVQVGPYKNAQAAAAGRDVLEAQGFKSITKR